MEKLFWRFFHIWEESVPVKFPLFIEVDFPGKMSVIHSRQANFFHSFNKPHSVNRKPQPSISTHKISHFCLNLPFPSDSI
jgi:hypothetical protein